MFTNPYFAERDAWAGQVAENSARHAFAWGDATTTGWGEVRLPDPIMFDCTFVDVPMVNYGFAVDDDERIAEGWYPRASGGVHRWLQDEKGYYIGAYVFVTVDVGTEAMTQFVAAYVQAMAEGTGETISPLGDDAPEYDLTHSFIFSGLAMKDASS